MGALEAEIAPFTRKAKVVAGHRLVCRMLRMYIAQQCFGLSDEGIEDALYDLGRSVASSALTSPARTAPDVTTLLSFVACSG